MIAVQFAHKIYARSSHPEGLSGYRDAAGNITHSPLGAVLAEDLEWITDRDESKDDPQYL